MTLDSTMYKQLMTTDKLCKQLWSLKSDILEFAGKLNI